MLVPLYKCIFDDKQLVLGWVVDQSMLAEPFKKNPEMGHVPPTGDGVLDEQHPSCTLLAFMASTECWPWCFLPLQNCKGIGTTWL